MARSRHAAFAKIQVLSAAMGRLTRQSKQCHHPGQLQITQMLEVQGVPGSLQLRIIVAFSRHRRAPSRAIPDPLNPISSAAPSAGRKDNSSFCTRLATVLRRPSKHVSPLFSIIGGWGPAPECAFQFWAVCCALPIFGLGDHFASYDHSAWPPDYHR